MFTDREFTDIAKVDKRGGRLVTKDKHALKNFYLGPEQRKKAKLDQESGNSETENDKDGEGNKFYDEDGKFRWEGQSSGSDLSEMELRGSELGESEMDELDQADYSDQMSGVWSLDEEDLEAKAENVLKQETLSPEQVKVGKRLAVQSLDWDSISATDLLSLFTSFCTNPASM